jgi:hypothetical protein
VIDIGSMGLHLTGADQALARAFTPKTGPGGQAMEPTDANAYMAEHIPHYTVYMWSRFALDTTLSALMLVSGIGLLRMKRWGRQLALVYAPYSILLRIATVTYGLMFVIPVTLTLMESEQQKSFAQMPPQQAQAAQQMLAAIQNVTRVMAYAGQLRASYAHLPNPGGDLPDAEVGEGRVRRGGDRARRHPGSRAGVRPILRHSPPTLTLPHKGGGNVSARGSARG